MKKRTLALALVICLLAIISVGSLAYFTATQNLTNYFAVAGIDPTDPDETDPDPTELFGVKLDEEDIAAPGSRTEEGNIYENILPGAVLKKDPTVTNTGKYDQWIRVKVTVTDADDWTAACTKHSITDLASIFNGYVDTDWTVGEKVADIEADTITYTYYLNARLAPQAKAILFESITIPAVFDIADMASLAKFQVIITSEAIQADFNGETAQEGFQNFS